MNDAVCDSLERHFDTAFAAPDGIKRLRELILTLAMQGKLVPQDPNDPPARQLLKEIEAEKKRLVKEGKIRGTRSREDAKKVKVEEMPYELPQGWECVRLGDILSFEYGDNLPADRRSNSGEFPVYGSNGIVGTHNIAFVNSPCIVIGRKGSAGALNLCRSKGCCVTDVAYYCIPPAVLDLSFCFKLLHTLGLATLGKGIKPGLNRNEAYEIALAIPPLPEQHRIVAKIDQLMARCDELEKLRDEREQKRRSIHTAALKQLLDTQTGDSFADAWQFITHHFGELYAVRENVTELRKAILQLAVMGKLVPQNPNDPPASRLLKEIEAEKKRLVKEGKIKAPKPLPPVTAEEMPYVLPSEWGWVRIGDVCSYIQRGKGPSYVESSTHRVISQKCVRWYGLDLEPARYIDPETLKKYEPIRFLCGGDLLWNSTGTGTIGRACLVPDELDGIELVADSHVTVVRSQKINKHFLWRWIQSPLVQSEIENSASGTTNQIELNTSTVINHLLPLPPLPEQHRIVAKIDSLMALCDTLEQRIDAATRQQTALLDAVMAQV